MRMPQAASTHIRRDRARTIGISHCHGMRNRLQSHQQRRSLFPRIVLISSRHFKLDTERVCLTIQSMHKEELDEPGSGLNAVTRRSFLGTTLAGGTAVLAGGI